MYILTCRHQFLLPIVTRFLAFCLTVRYVKGMMKAICQEIDGLAVRIQAFCCSERACQSMMSL